jgi:hypothetical protein
LSAAKGSGCIFYGATGELGYARAERWIHKGFESLEALSFVPKWRLLLFIKILPRRKKACNTMENLLYLVFGRRTLAL